MMKRTKIGAAAALVGLLMAGCSTGQESAAEVGDTTGEGN